MLPNKQRVNAQGPTVSSASTGKPGSWSNLLGAIRDLETNKLLGDATALGQGVYLLPLKNGLHPLRNLAGAASDYGFVSHTLFFDEKPDLVSSDPLPVT